MRRSALALAAVAVAAACSGGALAEGTDSGVPQGVIAAAGWLGWTPAPVAGKGCTAVLVAPDAALTAAHCVTRDPAAATPVPQGLIFVPGWGGDAEQPARRAVRIDLPAPRRLLDGHLKYDLALVHLDAPVAGVSPLPLAAPGDAGGPVFALGYASASPRHVRVAGCLPVLEDGPVLGFDCAALPGFSGGPMVMASTDGWRLVAVMVARGTGTSLIGTYALRPSDDLMAVLSGE